MLAGGDPPRAPFEGAPRAGAVGGLAWRGTFVRRRASPFLLVPGPAPLRVPFPFDVGLLVEAGGAAWEADRPDRLRLRPLRAALLLDLARYAGARRLAFGPEVAWETDLERGRTPVSRVVPFTAGVVTARLESGSGLAAAELAARAGAAVLTSGGTTSLVEVVLSADRTVLAVDDRPVALFLAGSLRRGAPGAGAEVTAGIRLVAARARGR